jgi:hypothetical protein
MLARRELLAAARDIRDGLGLGLRGTWILGLVATGRVAIQADVVKRYKVARSIIAEEVAPLTKARLVGCEPLREDRRLLCGLPNRGQRLMTAWGTLWLREWQSDQIGTREMTLYFASD